MARSGAGASTARVFVFDERLGAREGDEGEKVLAFFPSGTSANVMAGAVGLVEGVAGFVSPFAPVPSGPSPNAPLAQTLRTSRRRVACRRCEPGVWWALSLDADAAPERAVRDEALQSLLARAHAHFVLLHGGVQRVLDDAGHDAARRALAPFVADLGVRLSPSRGPHAGSLLPSLPANPIALDPGAAFLPTPKQTHLLLRAVVDAAVATRETDAPEVLAAAVFRDDRVAYATLALPDARVAASYVARCLAPGAAAGESDTKKTKTASVWGGDSIGIGPRAEALAAAIREEANAATRRLRERDDERLHSESESRSASTSESTNAIRAPPFMASEWRVGEDGFARWGEGDDASFVVPAWIRVAGGADDDTDPRSDSATAATTKTQLCAIRGGATTLALFLAPDARLTPSARAALLGAVADRLPELDAALETAAGPGGADRAWHVPGLRYAYRDEASLATRATPPAKIATLATETLAAVGEVRDELERARIEGSGVGVGVGAGAGAGAGRTLSTRVRAGRDAWIAGELSAEGRTMIVVAEGAGGTLLDASAAARRFADAHFEGVFDET
jgi:hypothetical protein